MTVEQRVAVVFDVAATSQVAAAEALLTVLQELPGTVIHHDADMAVIEGWTFPEAALKQVDGNDKPAMHLERDEEPSTPVLFRAKCADGDDYIWLDTGDSNRPVPVLGRFQMDAGIFDTDERKVGADALWDLIARHVPARTFVAR